MFKKDSTFHVLYTTDIEKTRDFYKSLGGTIKQYETDKVVVELGSFEFHFILNTKEPNRLYSYIAKPIMYGQGVIFYIETNNIKKLANRIKKIGGKLKADVFENHWDYLEILFEDPNGYKFAAYQEK